MTRYGSDKPDLRFGVELTELTEYFAATPFRVFQAPYVGAVVMPGGAAQPRRQLDAWQDWAKQRGAPGSAYVLVGADGELTARSRRTSPRPSGTGWPRRSAPSPATRSSSPPGDPPSARRCSARPATRSRRRCGLIDETRLVVRLGGGRADVRAGRDGRGRLDRRCTTRSPRPPPSGWTGSRPTPATPWPRPTTSCATATRSAAARSVSTARDVQQRVFDVLGHHRGGGRREVRLPAGGVQATAAAARRDRVRLGPGLHAAGRRRLAARGDRLPQDRRRVRPADRGAGADHRRAAPGGRSGRSTERGPPRPGG